MGRLRPVDLLLLGYLGFVSVVALARPEVSARGSVLLLNVLIAALILLLAREDAGWFGRGLRELYPLLLLIPLYGMLDLLSGLGSVAVHDATRVGATERIQHLRHQMNGLAQVQPSLQR